MLVVILGAVVSVPIVFLNVLNEVAALILVSGADFLAVFEKPQRLKRRPTLAPAVGSESA